ncbi:hypothetical protein G9A89_009775 [Geosiphon pyriformis]|nr:hypothetical protein G9A89_009775 [Geosiphon pyriformis]
MTSDILTPWSTDATHFDLSFKNVVNEHNEKDIFAEGAMILRANSPFFLNDVYYGRGNHTAQQQQLFAQRVFEYFPTTTFESILTYTYNGTVALEARNFAEILDLLLASGELCLQDLSARIQTYLVNDNTDWTQTHFALAYRTAFQDEAFRMLQVYCTETFEKRPEIIFRSKDFRRLQKRILLRLLKQKNPTIPQVEIWERLIHWGIYQSPNLQHLDMESWSSTHWSDLKRIIRDCVPLIRFYKISAHDFYEKVIPFEKALPRAIFHDILRHYLVPPPPPQYTAFAPPPPYTGIDSQIINAQQVGLISNWISWSKQSPLESKTRFRFNLLLRGSRDGFSPLEFHSKCDCKGPTVVIIKVKGTNQIIGGYNPDNWLSEFKFFSTSYHNTTESFIFSLGDSKNKEPIYSRIKDSAKAIGQYSHLGPDFGESDLSMQGFNYYDEKLCSCQQDSYERSIMEGSVKDRIYFSVLEYEVFQIVRNE